MAEIKDTTMDHSEFVEPDEPYIENVITVVVTERMPLSLYRKHNNRPNTSVEEVLIECNDWSQDMPNNYEAVIQAIEMGTTTLTKVELTVNNEVKTPEQQAPIPGL